MGAGEGGSAASPSEAAAAAASARDAASAVDARPKHCAERRNMIAFGFATADGDWRWQHLRDRARQLEPVHGLEFGSFVEALRQANPYSENRLLI